MSNPSLVGLRESLELFVEKAVVFSIERGIAVDRDIHDMLGKSYNNNNNDKVYMASETVTCSVLS